VAADLNGRLPERVEAGAYYAVAEGLANIAKHAQASTATVVLARSAAACCCGCVTTGSAGRTPSVVPGFVA
jgi:glucose-6-phosphate-specific signal transduction histidine kinase